MVGDWQARRTFVRDVLDRALGAAEQDRTYPEPDLIQRALRLFEQYLEELPAGKA